MVEIEKIKNKQAILEIIDKLKGLDYLIFAGFAVYLYTEGKRSFQDIDILFKHQDFKKFADRVGETFRKRKINKGDFITEDYFLETNYKGQDIEAIGILSNRDNEIKIFEKEFANRKKKQLFGKDIFLMPKEGVLVQKAILNREKDINDLKLLKGDINTALLKEIANLRGKSDKVFKALGKLGYDLESKRH